MITIKKRTKTRSYCVSTAEIGKSREKYGPADCRQFLDERKRSLNWRYIQQDDENRPRIDFCGSLNTILMQCDESLVVSVCSQSQGR